jgi:hypothetical protein
MKRHPVSDIRQARDPAWRPLGDNRTAFVHGGPFLSDSFSQQVMAMDKERFLPFFFVAGTIGETEQEKHLLI